MGIRNENVGLGGPVPEWASTVETSAVEAAASYLFLRLVGPMSCPASLLESVGLII